MMLESPCTKEMCYAPSLLLVDLYTTSKCTTSNDQYLIFVYPFLVYYCFYQNSTISAGTGTVLFALKNGDHDHGDE